MVVSERFSCWPVQQDCLVFVGHHNLGTVKPVNYDHLNWSHLSILVKNKFNLELYTWGSQATGLTVSSKRNCLSLKETNLAEGLRDPFLDRLRNCVILVFNVPSLECDAVCIRRTLLHLEERLKENKRHVEKKNARVPRLQIMSSTLVTKLRGTRVEVIGYKEKWAVRKSKNRWMWTSRAIVTTAR